MIKMRQIAVLSTLFAVFLTFTILTYASTTSSFIGYKPLQVIVEFQPATVKLTRLFLSLNSTTEKYDNLTLTLLNQGTENATISILAAVYSGNLTVATGTKTIYDLPPNQQADLTIQLSWMADYTAQNVTAITLTIQQQPTAIGG